MGKLNRAAVPSEGSLEQSARSGQAARPLALLRKRQSGKGAVAEPSRYGAARRRTAPTVVAAIGASVLSCLAMAPAIAAAKGPDRGYEIVSPYNKGGADVGVAAFGAGAALYSGAAADGNRMMFGIPNSPVGNAVRGIQYYASATRTADGWETGSTIPGPEPGVRANYVSHAPVAGAFLSADATGFVFSSSAPWVNDPLLPYTTDGHSIGAYLAKPNGLQWLTKPVDSSADPQPGNYGPGSVSFSAGGSADFGTSYFAYCGTLTASDAPRLGRSNFGFYVSKDGAVSSAGLLPDGSVDPDGAIPAGDAQPGGKGWCDSNSSFSLADPTQLGHQVSDDGSRAFFVSPNPVAENDQPSSRPPQLYVHRQGASSLLISRSLADPTQPTAAGISSVANNGGVSYIQATPDGSQVVFASTDKLTSDAPSGATAPLYYRFDVDTQGLSYLPNVSGKLRLISDDGQRVLYVTAGGSLMLDDHGTARTLHPSSDGSLNTIDIASPRVSENGDVWVFSSTKPLGDSPTHTPDTPEVYRYVVGDAAPTCISCVSNGAPASTGAVLDTWGSHGAGQDGGSGKPRRVGHNVSSDGSRVYFDTSDALLPTDINGKRDVYGWENGVLSLISAGTGPRDSFLLDTSASGDDVFFATADGLVDGDKDGSYDVYDSRVGGGFADVPSVVPCTGDECQGAPSAPPVLQGPLSPNVGPESFGPKQGKANAPKPVSLAITSKKGTATALTLKVRAPGAGTLRASGRGLATTSRKASRSSTYTIKPKLTNASRRTLARTGRLKLRVTVRFTPSKGKAVSKTASLTIKRATSASRKGN